MRYLDALAALDTYSVEVSGLNAARGAPGHVHSSDPNLEHLFTPAYVAKHHPEITLEELKPPKAIVSMHFILRVDLTQAKRRFLRTEGGRLGFGVPDLRIGDVLCVLQGASMPLVLRPAEKRGEHKIVGEAYVDGVMYGEVERMDIEDQEFVLVWN